jgi:hypothetical protein
MNPYPPGGPGLASRRLRTNRVPRLSKHPYRNKLRRQQKSAPLRSDLLPQKKRQQQENKVNNRQVITCHFAFLVF